VSIDKLDGSISQDYFDRMREAFRKEQRDTLQKIEQHQSAHETYVEEGVRLLELAQKAVMLYEKQEMQKNAGCSISCARTRRGRMES
jgi:hypothetical protein